VESDLKYYLYSIGLGLNNLGEIRKTVTWIEHIWKMAVSYHEFVFYYIYVTFCNIFQKEDNDGEPDDRFWKSFYPTDQFTTKFKKSKKNEMQLVKLDLSVLRRVKVLCERSILVFF
jgi:hypothetical protein